MTTRTESVAKAKSDVKPFVYFAVAVAALGGLLFGYDTGVISGAILFIKTQFSLSATMEEIVVSAVLVGAAIGAAAGGVLTDRFGRRKLIILAGIIFTASAVGTALAPTVAWLIAGMIVSGLAIGIASFISPMYIAELVPTNVRGALVASRLAEAKRVLQRVRTDTDVDPEIAEIQESMKQQDDGGIAGLFQPSLRMALIVGIGLAVFQQITGINTVIYYSPTIFKFAGIKGAGPAILAGAGLAMVMWCFHVVSIFLLDRIGRRPLLLIGVAGQIVGLATLGAAFHFQRLASLTRDLAIASLVIYVASFAVGLGPIFWLLISEIYPLKVRGAAMSAVTVTNWGMNLVVSVTFLSLVAVLGDAGTFWLYGVIAVAAWIFFYRLVPETNGKTLEQIEAYMRSGKHPRGL